MIVARTKHIGMLVLAAFAARHAALPPQSYQGSQPLVFDPTILLGWYDAGLHRETPPPVSRDSAHVAGLAKALLGRSLTTYLARLARTNGVWTVRCLGAVAGDVLPDPLVVASRCKPL